MTKLSQASHDNFVLFAMISEKLKKYPPNDTLKCSLRSQIEKLNNSNTITTYNSLRARAKHKKNRESKYQKNLNPSKKKRKKKKVDKNRDCC